MSRNPILIMIKAPLVCTIRTQAVNQCSLHLDPAAERIKIYLLDQPHIVWRIRVWDFLCSYFL